MTRKLILSTLVAAMALFAGLSSTLAHAEAKKISGTGKLVGIQSQTTIMPEDEDFHEIRLSIFNEVDYSDDPDFNDI